MGKDETIWTLESHTAAKHRVLQQYLQAWIPVMAQQALKVRAINPNPPRLMMVDGFAGPGVYGNGEAGSPLIMLNTLIGHRRFPDLSEVEFLLLFIEQDRARVESLRNEVQKLGQLPTNVKVGIEHGAFEDVFGGFVDGVSGTPNRRLVPTFAFIDPFGYSAASMSLTGRILAFPRCETLIFLPLSAVNRFVGRAGQEKAMTALFGSDAWRGALELDGPERSAYLLQLFEQQIGESSYVEHVRSFQLKTRDGNDYRLVFGVGHDRGLDLAKDAMWAVDRLNGESFSANTRTGDLVLVADEDLVDTSPLLRELRATFGTEWFTIDDAVRCTLHSPFKAVHLRGKTLEPAVERGQLEVDCPKKRRRNTFPEGTKLRFL